MTDERERPAATIPNPLLDAALHLDHVAESRPTDRFREKSSGTFERVSREPTFLSLRTVMTTD